MMKCFCGIVDRRQAFSLIFSRDHCQRSSPSRIFDTPSAEFEPGQNLSSGVVDWSCAVVVTTIPVVSFQLLTFEVARFSNLVYLGSVGLWVLWFPCHFFISVFAHIYLLLFFICKPKFGGWTYVYIGF